MPVVPSTQPLNGTAHRFVRVDDAHGMPVTVKILLEGVRRVGGDSEKKAAEALARYPRDNATIPFRPTRILLQDYTGVPAAVDLAAMRAAMQRAGKDPAKIEPLIPVDLVIDHSVQADFFGSRDVYERNLEKEYERNRERYGVLRWAAQAFKTFRVVPPGAGICHQVNLERLSRVVQVRDGIASLTVQDRATVSNMCPEYGATAAFFPVDAQTLRYLRATNRGDLVELVERYTRAQSMFREQGMTAPAFDEQMDLDLATIRPSLAGPKRPQDRVELPMVWQSFLGPKPAVRKSDPSEGPKPLQDAPLSLTAVATAQTTVVAQRSPHEGGVSDGSVVVAAITSCTNTSNPSVMIAAGLLAKKAVERGLTRKPWVKSSLAPGSKVVTEYYRRAGLDEYLDALGFNTVGYGCTTCIGNSGPLPEEISAEVAEKDLVVCSVLSGNRNFEARIHGEVKANYLASPPLVVAYALAGRMDIDLTTEPLDDDVYLRDIWPSRDEIDATIAGSVEGEMFTRTYADVYTGDERWRGLDVPAGDLFAWEPDSTYVRLPPYFDSMPREPAPVEDVVGARCLVMLGDSVTTDHISPAGAIRPDSPAGEYLFEHAVERRDFNSYGSRRGNHDVMVRGTFANVRLRNQLVPGSEGTWTVHLPDGEEMTIYDAALRYREEGVPTIVLAGKEYGSGSSRDWAAKGPALLGVRAVIAESFERIHRSNLVGMGILPLEFPAGESAGSLGLTGRETFSIAGRAELAPGQDVDVRGGGE